MCEFRGRSVGPEFDSLSLLKKTFFSGLPDKPLHFVGKIPYILSLCLFFKEMSGKKPTFFVESLTPTVLRRWEVRRTDLVTLS